jgi:5-formyltetrahydrofolate cyclo-ligase
MTSMQEEKQVLRTALRVRRTKAARTDGVAAGALAERFLRAIAIEPAAVVAGYWPIGDEIDVRMLLSRLRALGHDIALPAVVGAGRPLAFRRWQEDEALADGPFGTRQPPDSAAVVTPAVVIVPLLAFDRHGYRLGYGGGYYDRTLAALRLRRRVVAVGVAYAAQEVPVVPRERDDQALDWIVTDREAIEPGSIG